MGVGLSKKASVDMSAGTVLRILFCSSLCQSKHYVTGRHFQEFPRRHFQTLVQSKPDLYFQFNKVTRMTKHGICCKIYFFRGLRIRSSHSVGWFALCSNTVSATDRKLLMREPKMFLSSLLLWLSLSYNQTTLLRVDQILSDVTTCL